MDTGKWSNNKPAQMLMLRRKHHASCVVGNSLIVHGGMNANYTVISNFISYDLRFKTWDEIECESQPLEPLAGHTFIAVTNNRRKVLPKMVMSEESLDNLKQIQIIGDEGIYCFGGINIHGQCTNNIMYFELNT